MFFFSFNNFSVMPNPSTVRCNGMVISSDLVCDGEQNCYDGTDEPRDKNVDIRGLCPEPPFKTPIGEIILWVLLGLAALLLLSVIFYFVKRKVDEVYAVFKNYMKVSDHFFKNNYVLNPVPFTRPTETYGSQNNGGRRYQS